MSSKPWHYITKKPPPNAKTTLNTKSGLRVSPEYKHHTLLSYLCLEKKYPKYNNVAGELQDIYEKRYTDLESKDILHLEEVKYTDTPFKENRK